MRWAQLKTHLRAMLHIYSASSTSERNRKILNTWSHCNRYCFRIIIHSPINWILVELANLAKKCHDLFSIRKLSISYHTMRSLRSAHNHAAVFLSCLDFISYIFVVVVCSGLCHWHFRLFSDIICPPLLPLQLIRHECKQKCLCCFVCCSKSMWPNHLNINCVAAINLVCRSNVGDFFPPL